MIYQFATKVVKGLSDNQYISSDEIDIVSYGLFSIISKIMYGIITLIMGMFVGCIIESVCFYVFFLFIKKYAGGFHASTELRCFIISSFSILCSVCSVRLAINHKHFGWIVIALSFIAAFTICKYAPISSKEKQLDKSEVNRYKIISKRRTVTLLAISLILYSINLPNITFAISISIVLESIFLLFGKKINTCAN